MLDVNCAWSVPLALAKAGELADQELLWLDAPVWPPEDVRGLAQVRQRGIPIAAGENVAGVFGFQSLIEPGALDFAQPSVTKIGGIAEMVKVVHLCQAHGVSVMPRSPYFGPGLLAPCTSQPPCAKRPSSKSSGSPWRRTRSTRGYGRGMAA